MDLKEMYRANVEQDPESVFLAIYELSKVGNAATESRMNIDLMDSGFSGLFAVIGGLALEGAEMFDRKTKV